MERDINILLDTTNREIFDEQAAMWPGIAQFKKHAWHYVCTDPNCFMHCVQQLSRLFPSRSIFVEYINNCETAYTREEMQDMMVELTVKYPDLLASLMAADLYNDLYAAHKSRQPRSLN